MQKEGRKKRLYTVYENRNNRLVIKEGTAEECAEAMGMTINAFRSAIKLAKTQEIPTWNVTVIKHCIHCGQKFETKYGSSSVCHECKIAGGKWDEEIKARKKALRQAEKERKALKAMKAKEFKFNKKKCATCLYRMRINNEDKQWYCGYCYYTGHKRPCDISPDCAVHKTYSEDKRNQLICELKNTV